MRTRERKIAQVLVSVLAVTFLLVSGFSNVSIALVAESESETVGLGEVSRLVGRIGSSEEVDRETIINALEGLSENIVNELDDQGVAEETINRFREEFTSALDRFREGDLSRNQLADESFETTNQLGQDFENGLPVELLEENGINTEAIQTLKNKAETLSGPEVAEIARSISGKRDKDKDKENRKKGQEKAEEKREDAEERREEKQEKAEEKREEAKEKREEEDED